MGANPFMYGSCRKTTPLEEMRTMAKERMLDWTMDIIRSLRGEAFTSHNLLDRWEQHAPIRYKPNASSLSATLKKLEGRGKIRKTGNRTRYSNFTGSTEKCLTYIEA